METRAGIIKNFNKKYPDKKVTKLFRWDRERYVLAAPGDIEEIDPFYSYNIRTGAIEHFSPGEDIFKFSELIYQDKFNV
ncbi:MAG: hypothetical protein KBT27_03485 [Prevotellaceae bacterium]|nr:hypothetical protein [Candidatus Faecinaster equi]